MDPTILFFISQALSVITAIGAIAAEQMKKMKHILITQTLISVVVAISYILLEGGEVGFIVSLIGAVQSIVMYKYDKEKKSPPILLTLGFVIAFFVLSLYGNADKIINYFPAVAAVCFALALTQKNPKIYRIFDFSNAVLWLIYDAYILSGNFFVHLGIAISALIGMIRLDGLFKSVKKNNK